MNNYNDIIKDFRESNAQERLELYMQYRDMRSDFDQIEKEEISAQMDATQQLVIEPEKVHNKQSIFVKIKNCCLSLFL